MSYNNHCHFCNAPLEHIFIDLGVCPPSNAFLRPEQINEPEIFYPLKVYVCSKCLLVQVPEYKQACEIFTADYAYFSSYSGSWIEHAKNYVRHITEDFKLNKQSFIIEIGSNDGYLLQHAVNLNIPCLGIDPSTAACKVAEQKGVKTLNTFFTLELAEKLAGQNKQADLVCGINVFAHIPDINDLVAGIERILKPQGIMTMEIPHVMCLVEKSQFDTIYHEHYFYHSLFCVQKILSKHGLRLFHVEEFATHGGSIRIYACKNNAEYAVTDAVDYLLNKEREKGMMNLSYYTAFQSKVDKIRFSFMHFLMQAKENNKKILAYGVAAKGNTIINYLGIRQDLLPYVADASPYKQNMFLPASRIPVSSPELIKEYQPDYVIILPWNLKEEISNQLDYIRQWDGKFVVAVPELMEW